LSISAAYQGATGFQASTSSILNETVAPPANPVPALSALSPAVTSAGASAFSLTITGSGFISSSTAYWGTAALVTQFVSPTQLTAQVTASDVAAAGINAVSVQSPTPGGGTSNAMQFEVDSAGSGSGPTFTTPTASVSPGSSATYPVTLPSSATNVSVTCLNLPSGANCSYSASAGTLTITTSATTPTGTFQITVVFTETLPGVATGMILLPMLILPLLVARRKWARQQLGLIVLLVLALALTAASGCGGGSSSGGQTQPQTHVVTSSGLVTLNVH
jgi:hypothetical protein